jgi:hypothetical protein
LEEKKTYLEHHWVLAGKELDQEKELRKKIQKEHSEDFERVLRDEKEKNSTLRKNFDQQIEEMKQAHSKQCDELGKKILKATLEADRLHNQLVGAPRKTKIFETKSWKMVGIRLIVASIVLVVSRGGFLQNSSVCLCRPHSPEIRHSVLLALCTLGP